MSLQDPETSDPVFVNNLNIPVQVFDEARKPIQVMPAGLQGRHPNGIYHVQGEHFRQFSAPYGSLTLFRPPVHPSKTDKAIMDQVAGNNRRALRTQPASLPAPAPQPAQPAARTIPATAAPIAPPAHIGPPENVVLDTLTGFEIQRAAPKATPQERSDLATFVLKRRGGDTELQLHPSLAHYEEAMIRIADDTDVNANPPEDYAAHPENLPDSAKPASTVTADGVLSTSDGSTTIAGASPQQQKDAEAAAVAAHKSPASPRPAGRPPKK